MSYVDTRIANDKRKNKPNIVFPIINSFIAFVAIVFVTIVFIVSKGSFGVGLYVFCLIILIMYPLASWLNSYVLKKLNLKKINNYEKETEMLVKYIKRYENFRALELDKEVKATFSIEKVDSLKATKTIYNKDTCTFELPHNDAILMTFGVTFAGLEFNKITHRYMGLVGMLPRSIWYNKRLKAPIANKAKITIELDNFNWDNRVVIHALKRADIYYDNKSGWLVIGEKKTTVIDDVLEIDNNVYIVLRDNQITALWILVGPNLSV